jgi:hypothetical protein
MVAEVRFLKTRTVYSAIGDVIAYVSIALTAAALITGGTGPARRVGLRPDPPYVVDRQVGRVPRSGPASDGGSRWQSFLKIR